MITDVDDFFTKGCGRCARFDTADCAAMIWRDILIPLRALVQAAGLTEVVKWGHPCYMAAGRNVALIGATRGGVRLNFFQAGLLRDPQGVLVKQGANTQHPDMILLTSVADLTRLTPVIRDYLTEAAGYAHAGVKEPRAAAPLEMPPVLARLLAQDAELAAGFARLTPGRQKSYVLQVTSAKQAATAEGRILRAKDKIMAGKGALER
jgi:uncharacterized protein YdeI (YjbR/CyaY-like superfamily)